MARKTSTMKKCARCGETKRAVATKTIASDFYKDKTTKDGCAVWCKACEREYDRAYRARMKVAEVARLHDATPDALAHANLVVLGPTGTPSRPAPITTTTRKRRTRKAS